VDEPNWTSSTPAKGASVAVSTTEPIEPVLVTPRKAPLPDVGADDRVIEPSRTELGENTEIVASALLNSDKIPRENAVTPGLNVNCRPEPL